LNSLEAAKPEEGGQPMQRRQHKPFATAITDEPEGVGTNLAEAGISRRGAGVQVRGVALRRWA
jgi:hypothetical protein